MHGDPLALTSPRETAISNKRGNFSAASGDVPEVRQLLPEAHLEAENPRKRPALPVEEQRPTAHSQAPTRSPTRRNNIQAILMDMASCSDADASAETKHPLTEDSKGGVAENPSTSVNPPTEKATPESPSPPRPPDDAVQDAGTVETKGTPQDAPQDAPRDLSLDLLMQQIREMQERLSGLEKVASASANTTENAQRTEADTTQAAAGEDLESLDVPANSFQYDTIDEATDGSDAEGAASEDNGSEFEHRLQNFDYRARLHRENLIRVLEEKVKFLEGRKTERPKKQDHSASNEPVESPAQSRAQSSSEFSDNSARQSINKSWIEESDWARPKMPEVNPTIRRAEWPEFRRSSEDSEGHISAIDVLVGEPAIAPNMQPGPDIAQISGQSHPPADGQPTPVPERIRIHSKYLKDELYRAMGMAVGNLTQMISPIVILRPFKMLMRCEKQLRTRCAQLEETLEATADTSVDSVETPEKEESRTTLEHLRCLLSFIDTDIKSRMDYLNNDPRCTKVSFADVWYLFKPGDEVIHKSGKAAYRVLEVSSPSDHATPWLNSKWRGGDDGETPDTSYFVTCVAIDFDGKFFGPVKWGPWEIEKFRGEKPINTFDVYPIRFYGRDAKSSSVGENTGDAPWQILRRQLVERGILFALTASVRHMYYAGPIIDTKEEIESQVVIDCGEAFNGNYTGSQKPVLDLLIGEDSSPMREKKPCVAACCFGEVIEPDFHIDRLQKDEYINSLIPVQENTLPSVTIYRRSLEATKTPGSELTEGELLITNFRVYGFILRSRTWAMLDLTYLSDIETINKAGESVDATDRHRKSAFDRLVLPDEHKRLIHSLVAQHFRDKQRQNRTTEDEQMDIVRGKGKGLVLLLHGAPGVGKTSTAEAVAERFKKPLFQITCGDLGSTAKEVEDALSKNFALANKWGCILLLDEADVFLATRKREDFTRNGLVAVFLRVLEYYAGVLFLTTNRIGDFDEAFTSRIHMSLYYPPLNEYSTKKVFELNLEMISERFRRKGRRIIVEESQIFSHIKEYFEKHEHARWNGRQIRNSCQTALALAEYDAQGSGDQSISTEIHLRQGHFKIVSDAYLDFIQYLKTVRNTSADEWAKQTGIRALEKDLAFLKAELAGEGGFKSKLGRMKATAAAAVAGDSELAPFTSQLQQQQWMQSQQAASPFGTHNQQHWSATVHGHSHSHPYAHGPAHTSPKAPSAFPAASPHTPAPGQPQVSYLNPNIMSAAGMGVASPGPQFQRNPSPQPYQQPNPLAQNWPSQQNMMGNGFQQAPGVVHDGTAAQHHALNQQPGGMGEFGSQQPGSQQ